MISTTLSNKIEGKFDDLQRNQQFIIVFLDYQRSSPMPAFRTVGLGNISASTVLEIKNLYLILKQLLLL